jgi:N-acetyl-beta-hexosaminidase
MIDVARHFMPLPTLKRQIDAMERVKLNVLHLHLSDNEGFQSKAATLSEASRRFVAFRGYSH